MSKLPPKKPPRKHRKPKPTRKAPPPPAPALPPREYSYDEIVLVDPPQPNSETNSENVESLIDFDGNHVIPLLAPPPKANMRQQCLPNAPYDPLDAILSNDNTDMSLTSPVLQPTVVQSSQNSNIFSTSNGHLLPDLLTASDSETSKDSFDSPPMSRANGFLVVEKPVIPVLPNNYVPAGQVSLSPKKNGVDFWPQNPFSPTAIQNSLNPFPQSNGIDNLFITNNGLEEPALIPTAPFQTESMVRKDSALQQNQLFQTLNIDSDSNENELAANLIYGVCELILTL